MIVIHYILKEYQRKGVFFSSELYNNIPICLFQALVIMVIY